MHSLSQHIRTDVARREIRNYQRGRAKSNREYSLGVAPRMINPRGVSPTINDQSLVNRFRSWTYIAATTNGAAVGGVPLRLFATISEDEQMPRVRHGLPLSDKQVKQMVKQNTGRLTNQLRGAKAVVEIFEHPFLTLMGNPNPWRSQFELLEETTIFQDITGDSYWLIGMDPVLGIPNTLNILPSQFVRIVPDKTGFIKGYLFGKDSTSRIALQENEVIHFRRPNPRDPYYGMGCLEASIVAVNQYDSMDTYETALNDNMGVPSFVVNYKGKFRKGEARSIEADWNRTLRGMANSGKVKATDQEYDIKQMAINPRDMGFMQGRKWTRNEIANAFDVPISMLETENVNKANAQAGNEQYARRAIMPRLRRIEDHLNKDLIPLYNEPRIFCAFDNPVPEDDEFELKRSVELTKAGLIKRNEGRAMQNIRPDLINGDKYVVAAQGESGISPILDMETTEAEETEE